MSASPPDIVRVIMGYVPKGYKPIDMRPPIWDPLYVRGDSLPRQHFRFLGHRYFYQTYNVEDCDDVESFEREHEKDCRESIVLLQDQFDRQLYSKRIHHSWEFMKKMRLVSRGFRECFNIRSLIQEGLIVYSTLHRDWAWAKRLLACTHAERPGRGSKQQHSKQSMLTQEETLQSPYDSSV